MKRILLIVFGAMVPLLALEGGLRLAGYDPFEPFRTGTYPLVSPAGRREVDYELLPNINENVWSTPVQTNSWGMRDDKEYSLKKSGLYRIAVVGDSTTFGKYLPLAATYPKKLEKALNGRSPDAEVLNFGVPGYNMFDYVDTVRYKVLPFHPDLVIVGLCVNDVGVTPHMGDPLRHPEFTRLSRNPFFKLRMAQWMLERLMRSETAYDNWFINEGEHFRRKYPNEILPVDENPAVVADMRKIRFFYKKHLVRIMRRYWNGDDILHWYGHEGHIGLFRYGLQEFKGLRDDHHLNVIFVLIPYLNSNLSAQWLRAYDILELEAADFGFQVVDMYEPFHRQGLETLRAASGDFIHQNERANEIIADRLLPVIREARRRGFPRPGRADR